MTLTDLYANVLKNMQVTAAGESPDADDLALIASKYRDLHALLLVRNLANWTVDEDVPDESVEPLTQAISFAAASSFGRSSVDFATGAIAAQPLSISEIQLRQNLARKYVSWPQATEYF